MERQIVYPSQVPLETDLLNTNRNTMLALGKLAAAIFGTGGLVNGLAVAPTSPASLDVSIGAGEIYQLANVDDTAYSSLPADTTDTVVKQGILLQPTTLACPAPSAAGFSIDYLIEAKFEELDTGSVVLPYYNASNPQQAYSGPNNTGAAQAVTRSGIVSLQAKPGIAATTGTQTAPAVDAGYIALAVVTVANGQTTITAGDITAQASSTILPQSMLATLLGAVQLSDFTGTNQLQSDNGYQKLPGGLIFQWATIFSPANYIGGTLYAFNFPVTFPNNCHAVIASNFGTNDVTESTQGQKVSLSQGGVVWQNSHSTAGTGAASVIAIGF